MPNDSPNNSLLQTVTQMLNTIVSEGAGYDTLFNVLSLLCLLLILNRTQPVAPTSMSQLSPPTNSANPLQKIIGDLTKNLDGTGGGGPSPDMLMSLLPLLNSPQIKAKLNPANISNILGLMNNLGGGGSSDRKEPPAAGTTSAAAQPPTPTTNVQEIEKKELGRSLNWKTNFQNEKEV